MCVFRVKAATVRHAVWTLVTAGMLVQAVLIPLAPPALRVRILRPVTVAEPVASVEDSADVDDSSSVVVYSAPPRRLSVDRVAGYVYAIGVLWCSAQLLYAAWFTRRLVRESMPVGGRRYESRWISVPVTVGRKILLPVGWREWDSGKLAAVLAHEEAHVARADWAVAAMARVNRCVFWFHPLAWWLERVLARLAEQVCDDAAMAAAPDREKYASVLMDMARAAGSQGGRVPGAVAMAKETNVEMRINRILDASRRTISAPLSRVGWCGMSVCGSLLVYGSAAVQLAPSQVRMQAPSPGKAAIPADTQQPPLMAQAGAQRSPAPPRPVAAEDAGVGSLSGIVRDPSGARVPDAAVVVHGSGAILTTSTNTFGEWSFSGLRAGSYTVAVLAAGFAGDRSVAVDVVAGVERKIDTNLTIASSLETVTISATGNPQPSPAAQSELPRVGGNVQAPRIVKRVFPVYPPSARDQGVSGPVVISAVIGKDGTVLHAQVMNDSPAELREAALRAVQGWAYKPVLLNGEPVENLTTITINFQLKPE